MKPSFLFAIVVGITPMCCLAEGKSECFLVVCSVDGLESETCSVSPPNLTANLPSGLAVTAIRSFTRVAQRGDAGERACSRVARLPITVSLDKGSIYGAISINGTIQATGILRFEPNDGGTLDFRPDTKTFASAGPFFRSNFERIKLDDLNPPLSLRPPRSLSQAMCWQAKATIEATDFGIVVGDSSSAGTYVRTAHLWGIRDFRSCKWGSE